MKLSAVETFNDIKSVALLAEVGFVEAELDCEVVSFAFVGGLKDAAIEEEGGGIGLGTLGTVLSVVCRTCNSFNLCSYYSKIKNQLLEYTFVINFNLNISLIHGKKT